MSDLAYYRPTGASLSTITEIIESNREMLARQFAFAAKHGGTPWGTSTMIVGIHSKSPPTDPGWMRQRGKAQNVWIPRSNKAGNALLHEMGALSMVDGVEIARRLGCPAAGDLVYNAITKGWCRIGVGYAAYNEQIVLSARPDTQMPADCIRLRMSEYWALREAADAAMPASEEAPDAP